ncbi:MAG: hypothetical protein JNK37_25150 [Verrucomicrobiales bacterium]|nr:hypothetical protein [Verrucomicrobiales bacterium]
MSIDLIKALAPSILVLALVVPALTGFLGRKVGVSIALGWTLFVLSFAFQDLFSLMIANHFHGRAGVKAVAVDQPGTVAAVFVGWLQSLICHFIGRGIRRILSLASVAHNLHKSRTGRIL